ncbi:histone-fold-containing protein [Xylaria nigripes]|nr:histone-fold-containing protein [Xylaria nigripes]
MPKKIPPSKRADASMAQFVESQFVLDPDVHQTEPVSAMPAPLKHAKSSAPAAQMDSSLIGDREKEKDKEKEKKDKEKEKDGSKDAVTIEDLNLPKSIITRLAKGVLPSNTQIQANAILAMSKSATVFINHLANAANEHTQNNNKKTIMPSDVFEALGDIEFPFFRERLEAEFKKFNDTQTSKRNTYRRKVAAQKKADKANTSVMSTASAGAESDSAPRAKKQKPNATHEDSTMDIDGDETLEPHEPSDADTEPDPEHEEDEEEDDDDQENAEEEDDEEEEEEDNQDDIHDRLEESQHHDDDDDALDNSGDSD